MEIVLEDSGYIAAPEGQRTLRFTDEKQQATFELGVSMLIYKWDTLATAVENNWGGPDSADKRDWITGIIIDLFTQGNEVDTILIHETLFNAMEDEFDVLVQDDSTVLIAQAIIQTYQECAAGVFDRVHQLYQRYLEKEEYRKSHGITKSQVKIEGESESEDDDEEDDDDEDMEMDVDETPARAPQGPVVDDDGFTVVTKKGGRR